MSYTLQDYLTAAGVQETYDIAKQIIVTKPPRPYQITAVTNALADVRYGLFDQPGVGKTIPAQAILLYYLLWGNRCLVIMPPALLKQFKSSLVATYEGVLDHFNLHILNDSPARRTELYEQWDEEGWPDMLFLSYNMFVNRPKMPKLEEGEEPKKNTAPRLFTRLKRHYDVFVCDEAQALCKPGSWSNKGLVNSCGNEGDSALLLMTGTPMPNTPIDAYGLVKLITPGVYRNKKQFEKMHCEYGTGGDGYRMVVGYKDMGRLNECLYEQARRVLKIDVLTLDKPNIIPTEIELYPEHIALYKQLVRERFLEVEGELIDALQAQSLRQKCLQIITCPDMFSEKKIRNAPLEMLDELLDSVGVGHLEKVVIFTHFRKTTEMLKGYLAHLNPCVVYGGRSNNSKEIQRYIHDDTARVMVANPQSGGVGIDGMQDVGSTAIFFEPTSVPGRFEQAMDRLHRDGQMNIVNVYIFNVLKTISPRLTKQMLGKVEEIKRVLLDRQTVFDELMGL